MDSWCFRAAVGSTVVSTGSGSGLQGKGRGGIGPLGRGDVSAQSAVRYVFSRMRQGAGLLSAPGAGEALGPAPRNAVLSAREAGRWLQKRVDVSGDGDLGDGGGFPGGGGSWEARLADAGWGVAEDTGGGTRGGIVGRSGLAGSDTGQRRGANRVARARTWLEKHPGS